MNYKSALKLEEELLGFGAKSAIKRAEEELLGIGAHSALKLEEELLGFGAKSAIKRAEEELLGFGAKSAIKRAEEQMLGFDTKSAMKLSEHLSSLTGFQSVTEMYKEQQIALKGISDVREILKSQKHTKSNVIDIKELLLKKGVKLDKFIALEPIVSDSISIEKKYKVDNLEQAGLDGFYEVFLKRLESRVANILFMAIFTIFLNLISSYIYENYISAKNELKLASNKKEVKSLVRKASNFDKSALIDYRVIHGDNLHIRKKPSMKGEIVMKLKLGSLVEVIDRSKKSWLFVEYENDNIQVTGWVSRRYTTIIK